MKKKVMFAFGTRPEAIKMAPVVLGFRQRPKEFECVVVVTAQHRQMLDQVLKLFEITPDHDLNIMSKGQTLESMTDLILRRLDDVFKKQNPNLVLVHGDTTTAFATALLAFYKRIPVGHVEAGLRSFDLWNPYPEEFNRRMVDMVSSLHFAPTASAEKHLLQESMSSSGIFVTGNTGIDALTHAIERIDTGHFGHTDGSLAALKGTGFVLITAHRRENFGKPMRDFCHAIRRLALERQSLHFVYPVHMNPNVQEPVKEILSGIANVHLLEPLEYSDFISLMKSCIFVVTDSGGLQEEAPAFGKPVLVLRKVTERPEAVESGTVRIIGTDTETVYRWMTQLLDDERLFSQMARAVNPYGDGKAAERTVEAVRYFYGMSRVRPPRFVPQERKGVTEEPVAQSFPGARAL